ncbi:MAG: glycoside hydrolase family 3 N-terminal domain-containing protein [Propionibacteriaceae bacterium]
MSQQVGQLFMVGISSGGLGRGDADVLSDGEVGSVIFLGNSTAGADRVARLVTSVRAVTATPRGIETMLTVDQEGGQVQRLKGSGFDRIPSAQRQAQLSDGRLRDDAETWGKQLKKVGIDADLAPVADVVPKSFERVNQPIGLLDRGYGPDAEVVADKVSAFIAGMDEAGIATSVKHFPGLGQVRGNTDFSSRVVDRSTTRHDADLAGFAAGVKDGTDMVMVSTAFYDRIDPDHRAAFSKKIITTMVRGDLGFNGVVISDDLAARAVRDLSPGQRALQFLGAGGDLAIVGDPDLADDMISAVTSRARSDRDFAADVRTKATRVVEMKHRRGLADCG